MSFDEDLNLFTVKLEGIEKNLLPAVASEVLRSIQEGSELTGAPGQPVGQYGPGYHQGEVGGTLRASYQLTFPTAESAEVSSNSEYAVQNETGVSHTGGPYVQRSTVGGRFSVAMTRVGFPRIVEHVANASSRPEGFTPNTLPPRGTP